ncbi:MAG: SDR family oxidoreductase [Rubrobacteraceae bacterium]
MTQSRSSLEGKICMVTGATSGLGEVTARELAKRGATMVLVGRDRDKTEAVAQSIAADSGNGNVEWLLADLSSQEEIRRLAGEFRSEHETLDVLVNNAGAFFTEYGETVDGVERTFAVNHLNYFLLTNLLLGPLKAAAPSRVVNVASGAHKGAGINLEDPSLEGNYSGWRAYGQSKLANIMFTYELARRLEGTGVTANALHPGAVATNIGSNNKVWYARPVLALFRRFSTPPEKGARTSIYLASSPEVEGVSGGYFAEERPASSSEASRDAVAARKLWELSETLTGLSREPGAWG